MRLLDLKLVLDLDFEKFLTPHTPQAKFTLEAFTSEEGLAFALALSGRLDSKNDETNSETLAETGA